MFERCYARSERFNPLGRCREPTLPIAFIPERGGCTGIGGHVDLPAQDTRTHHATVGNLAVAILGFDQDNEISITMESVKKTDGLRKANLSDRRRLSVAEKMGVLLHVCRGHGC
ncbi:hypothetical protein P3T23_000014 [Paraburkholderia sp. GAS448]